MRGGASWRLAVLLALSVPWLSGCILLGIPPYLGEDRSGTTRSISPA
jgi:hypothetical protein